MVAYTCHYDKVCIDDNKDILATNKNDTDQPGNSVPMLFAYNKTRFFHDST